MRTQTQELLLKARDFEKGRRLYCEICHSEIEIINPCTCTPRSQVLRCCGQDMTPEVGVSVNMQDD
jgi:hypothetical protein